MKFGIMQPYFFPYLGYFELIHRTDRWIVFDAAQYIRHGWVNRNRILHPKAGWQYIIVPLRRHSRETPISQIETAPPSDWRERIRGQIMHYKKSAPFFRPTVELVERCLAGADTSLSRRNTHALGQVCEYLGIAWRHEVFSQLSQQIAPVNDPGDWALEIAAALGATEYLNPPGGEGLFNAAKFGARGIRLRIQEPFEFAYACRGYAFEPNLSVLDALMWNPPETIKAHLDRRKEEFG